MGWRSCYGDGDDGVGMLLMERMRRTAMTMTTTMTMTTIMMMTTRMMTTTTTTAVMTDIHNKSNGDALDAVMIIP